MLAIDLGLSVRWGDRNIGANTPTDAGELYAWAEILPKDNYTWENYLDWLESGPYGPYKETHFRRITHKISSFDDALTIKHGAMWRIPTADEFEELITKCRWISTKENNVSGYRIYGANGNSIFLPICGDSVGFLNYWSSTRMNSPQHAKNLEAYTGKPRVVYRARFYGFCLRGVSEKKK